MAISVVDAVTGAYDRTRRMLFEPFDIGKWFVLGFCAWLAYLGGEGGGGGGGNFPADMGKKGGRGMPSEFQAAIDWCGEHLVLIVAAAAVVLLIGLALWIVCVWLSSRGRFMFLDGVVKNRGAIVEPWRQFRPLANSLFWFRMIVGLIGVVLVGLAAALGVLLAWEDLCAWDFGEKAVIGLVVSVALILPLGLIGFLVGLLLRDFVIPVMYQRSARVLAAWGIFGREILRCHFWMIVLFYLLKIVLSIGIVVIACCATCITCCLTALPYVGTVILLPLFVFERCYSLYFIQQVSPAWRIFQDEPPPYVPAVAPPS